MPVLRIRACAGLIFALGVFVACAPAAQGPLPGASDAWKKPGKAARPPEPPAPTWDVYAEVRQWPPLNATPFASRGHQPEQQVDVRVNPESRGIYQGLVTDSVFPDGSVLAELPHGSGGRGYGMRKANGSWRFFELDARGGVISSGILPLCAGCHAQAPADGIFGLPRASPGSR